MTAFFDTVEADEGVLLPVHADSLTQLLCVADDIENVILDLERETDGVGIGTRGILLRLTASGGDDAETASSADERIQLKFRTRFQPGIQQRAAMPGDSFQFSISIS